MRLRLALACAALAACAKPAGGPDMAVYEDPGRHFSVSVPADWKVLQRDGGASFFGPPSGPAAFTATLSLSLEKTDARAYHAAQMAAGGQVGPLAEKTVAGRPAYAFFADRVENELHSTKTKTVRINTTLVPLKDGLLVLSASSNPGGEGAADEAFGKALSTLQIR